MKKVFAIFAIAGMLVACGDGDKKTDDAKEGAEQMMNDAKEGADNMMQKADSTVDAVVDSAKTMVEEATK
ncbi:MAG TPA: hypothetical protein PLU37_10855 [Chitinophagaceae bacterium]|nr:hypothetical protein [Chitinophagaceae bacterium]HPG12022.1 hypothetical protein [Chitinophagaceae bacterium]